MRLAPDHPCSVVFEAAKGHGLWPSGSPSRAWMRCPCCETPGLELYAEEDGTAVLECPGRCSEESILEALGLDEMDLEPRRETIRFRTPRELRGTTPEAPEYVWEGYVARGALTIVGGKPKTGKSTLVIGGLSVAVASRLPTFLGRRITGGPVVIATEEGATTALAKLPDSDDVHVLTREGAWPKPSWPELLAAAMAEAERTDAAMIVVDSFSFWASLGADAEKDAGAAQAALAPLLEAAAAGFAVLLVHHQRKAGGEGGDALRGSSAIAANADMVLEIERLGEDGPACFRQLLAVGRWTDTPGVLVYDYHLTERSWRVVGQGDGREVAGAITWRERVLNALPDAAPGSTYDDLEVVLGADKRKWLPALNEVVAAHLVVAVGRGRKGDPKRFWIGAQDSIPGFHPEAGTETNTDPEESVSVFRPSPIGGTETKTSTDFPSHPERDGNGNGIPVRDEWESEELLESWSYAAKDIFDATGQDAQEARGFDAARDWTSGPDSTVSWGTLRGEATERKGT